MGSRTYPQEISVLYYGQQSIKIDGKKVIRHIFALPDSADENAKIRRLCVLTEQAKHPVRRRDIWLVEPCDQNDLAQLIAEEFPGIEAINLIIQHEIY